jgi:clan AA aspartic protease
MGDTIEAIVDTGFSGYMTLPESWITSLELVRHSSSDAVLADGTLRKFFVYEAEVWWADSWRPILVSKIGSEALLGMRLLTGYELLVQVVPGGAVKVMSIG